jgi:NADH-quinone oxidoreductase subunit D
MADIRNFTLNFGPQHPAAHGVLRLVLELDGEVVQRADPHIGLLHRATEKLSGNSYLGSVGSIHGSSGLRVDDVQRACLLLGYRKLLGIEVPERGKYIRTMFDEVTRILNHLLWIGCHALDVGAMTMALYTFREREDLNGCL